jgi:hypothetical protein
MLYTITSYPTTLTLGEEEALVKKVKNMFVRMMGNRWGASERHIMGTLTICTINLPVFHSNKIGLQNECKKSGS